MSDGSTLVFRNILTEAGRADLVWTPFREGVEAAWLLRSADGGPAAALLRYRPGSAVPRHRHEGAEHIFILEGAQEDETYRFAAGDLAINPEGSAHKVSSAEGCVALLIWEKPPAMLE